MTEGRRIPARSVVMGMPGKVVREITSEELEQNVRDQCTLSRTGPTLCAAVTRLPGHDSGTEAVRGSENLQEKT